jgi:hypothetical protein
MRHTYCRRYHYLLELPRQCIYQHVSIYLSRSLHYVAHAWNVLLLGMGSIRVHQPTSNLPFLIPRPLSQMMTAQTCRYFVPQQLKPPASDSTFDP